MASLPVHARYKIEKLFTGVIRNITNLTSMLLFAVVLRFTIGKLVIIRLYIVKKK